jgi:hypothetical protein
MNAKLLALSALFALTLTAQRRMGQSNIAVPVPPDPHELVTGTLAAPTAAERGTALGLLQGALQNSQLHISGTAPYRIDVSFTTPEGQGQLTETWLSPQVWRWSATLGGASYLRGSTPQGAYANSDAPVPMRLAELRNAIFAYMYDVAIGTQLRTAPVTFNGKPATCALTSGVTGSAPYAGRLWEELEYCFDNASGLLVSDSFAPGVFTVYSYANARAFHGHTLPDHLTTYVAGNQVLDATLEISDAAAADPGALAPAQPVVARGAVLTSPIRQGMPIPAPAGVSKVTPVLVHANVVNGHVVDAEVSAATDPSLAAAAIDAVKRMTFGSGAQQQAYIAVKFLPGTD